MKVTVKLSNESSFQVTVPDNATVEDLKVASLVALPPDSDINRGARLWYSGRKMEFSKVLSTYGITSESKSSVYLTSGDDESAIAVADDEATIAEQQPHTQKKARTRSKSKNRCCFNNCHSPALRMTGECQFCKGKFCSKHRLLEMHNCKGLKTCKDKSFERNALKLRNEQTVSSKV